MSYIKTVAESEADGPIREVYNEILTRTKTMVPNIYKIQSLAPESLRLHDGFYRELMFARSPLRRYQREMIATYVSKLNECFY